jgi:hypothetical protein
MCSEGKLEHSRDKSNEGFPKDLHVLKGAGSSRVDRVPACSCPTPESSRATIHHESHRGLGNKNIALNAVKRHTKGVDLELGIVSLEASFIPCDRIRRWTTSRRQCENMSLKSCENSMLSNRRNRMSSKSLRNRFPKNLVTEALSSLLVSVLVRRMIIEQTALRGGNLEVTSFVNTRSDRGP